MTIEDLKNVKLSPMTAGYLAIYIKLSDLCGEAAENTGLQHAKEAVIHFGSAPLRFTYSFRDGITLAFHFDVELREIASNAWSIKGFLKRSVTAAAKSSNSSFGKSSVGIISS